jgi:hypothetical protein
MNRFIRLGLAAALPAAALCLSSLGGCMSQDLAGSGSETLNDSIRIDPFPKPLGQALIPLEQEFYATFKYVEFDTTGGLVLRQDLPLHIIPKQADVYGYAFEDTRHGYLLSWKDGNGNRDSAGVYIVGAFRDSTLILDSAAILWLPQFPKPGTSWYIEPGRKYELVSQDTAFWTETLFPYENEPTAPVRLGFQRQPSVLFKETYGDTLTYYYFRRGVGCVGLERSVHGKLLASGTLQSFYVKTRIGKFSGGTD